MSGAMYRLNSRLMELSKAPMAAQRSTELMAGEYHVYSICHAT